YRLLTAGASTNDILDQYVSTIKALRTIDPTGVFLEAVGEPIREYLRGRKDTVKCIVNMLTDGTGGNNNRPGNTGDSLLEELTRDEENQENTCIDDDINTDDKQGWIDIQGASQGAESWKREVSFDILDATIISSNFWPPCQDEDVNIPEPMDHLLGDYAKRYHEIKTPRKLLWKKNLGTVKLELEFEDRTLQFTVIPVHATIIMKFQEQTSWTSKSLAAAIGLPVDTLQRRVNFWISKGIVAESSSGGDSSDHLYTLVDSMSDAGKTAVNIEEMIADDYAERSVASVEDQLRKEMVVYE
nr:anaphase-promoting complex subunit 2 isoform X1 [Tanacetum cinerariifolium]